MAVFDIDAKIQEYVHSPYIFKVFALFYINLINLLQHISKIEFALATIGDEYREEIELSIHQMEAKEEALANDLQRFGGDAWSKLHEQIISNMTEQL